MYEYTMYKFTDDRKRANVIGFAHSRHLYQQEYVRNILVHKHGFHNEIIVGPHSEVQSPHLEPKSIEI